ncbi:MAG: hypothetical protein R2757_03670 [Draconibacterium sp.]
MKYLTSLILILLLASCSDENIGDYRNNNNKFNIYLVKQSSEYMYREKVDSDSLQLEKIPWVKSSDIEFYDWSAHTFYLNKEVAKSEYSARNFVVASGDKRLFTGVFWPMYMSSFPTLPSVMPEDDLFSPKDVIRFNSFGWNFPGDLETNSEFKNELIQAGLFREGISVDILKLKKISSTALEYTFRATNLDIQKIYILDPNKMGAARFHYYTNGISLQQNDNYFWPNNFETTSSEKISENWYYKLKPGESIIRTVKMSGYTNLPSGNVKVTFQFPGAYYLKSKEWKKPDGRIWIGSKFCEGNIQMN